MSVEADWLKTIKITLEVTKKKANAFDLILADTLDVESYYKVFYIFGDILNFNVTLYIR